MLCGYALRYQIYLVAHIVYLDLLMVLLFAARPPPVCDALLEQSGFFFPDCTVHYLILHYDT
jgi:hypothetical protein